MSSLTKSASWHQIPWYICVIDTVLSMLLSIKEAIVLGVKVVINIKLFSKKRFFKNM